MSNRNSDINNYSKLRNGRRNKMDDLELSFEEHKNVNVNVYPSKSKSTSNSNSRLKSSFDFTSWIQQGVCRSSCYTPFKNKNNESNSSSNNNSSSSSSSNNNNSSTQYRNHNINTNHQHHQHYHHNFKNNNKFENTRDRTASFSSNTFSTEDNSSFNDSFDDTCISNEGEGDGESGEDVNWDSIIQNDSPNSNQGAFPSVDTSKGSTSSRGHQYNSSEDSLQSPLHLSALRIATSEQQRYQHQYQHQHSSSTSTNNHNPNLTHLNQSRVVQRFSPKKYSSTTNDNNISVSTNTNRTHHTAHTTTTSHNNQNNKSNHTNMPAKTKKPREWRSAIDPKSGRKYYYDIHTRETQWQKPLELASKSERRLIEEKEQKQNDFFKAMEKNILKSMRSGIVPGSQNFDDVEKEDTVESLPDQKGVGKRCRPKLFRTISSMDQEMLKELTDVETSGEEKGKNHTLTRPQSQYQSHSQSNKVFSPDRTATTFFDSLPQPGYSYNHTDMNINMNINSNTSTDTLPCLVSASNSSSTDSTDIHSKENINNNMNRSKLPVLTKPNLSKPNLSKRNTCGTMYVGSTMAAPDKDAAIKCLCGVYRTHIIQSTNDASQAIRTKFAEYEIFNDVDAKGRTKDPIPTRIQRKPASILEAEFGIEMTFESSVGTNANSKNARGSTIPSLEEITDYFRFIFNKAQMESDTIIMSLIYVERLLRETNGGVRPNLENWKSLLFSCMIMASKVWDDLSMWNVDFSQACPRGVTFSLKRINELELAVLSCLKYNVKVPASEYAKYYFLMRSMLIRSGLAGEEFRSSKPLDLEGAKKFEVLTASYNAKPVTPSNLRRSKSLGHDGNSDSTSPTCMASTQVKLEQVVNM